MKKKNIKIKHRKYSLYRRARGSLCGRNCGKDR